MYILINPITNKPIQFSTFKDDNYTITRSDQTDENNQRIITTITALCIEQEYDIALLDKTYNPSTNTFS